MSDLSLYEQQLSQIQNALKTCDNDADRADLLSLESNLQELILLAELEEKRMELENINRVDDIEVLNVSLNLNFL